MHLLITTGYCVSFGLKVDRHNLFSLPCLSIMDLSCQTVDMGAQVDCSRLRAGVRACSSVCKALFPHTLPSCSARSSRGSLFAKVHGELQGGCREMVFGVILSPQND